MENKTNKQQEEQRYELELNEDEKKQIVFEFDSKNWTINSFPDKNGNLPTNSDMLRFVNGVVTKIIYKNEPLAVDYLLATITNFMYTEKRKVLLDKSENKTDNIDAEEEK